jgi:glucosyl-dolichyl phosphate glucuronosyltransferase
MTMRVTVILCTYNRCQRLSKALASVAASVMPASVAWEVLVVDNNSKDQTREVIEDFCRRYPGRFRYLLETKQGKSFALNTAIKNAPGDILAFMDDDVTVEPAWLQSLVAPLNDEQWVGTGGRIRPDWSAQPPDWLPLDGPYNLGGMLALFDQGDSAGDLEQPPFGTNMAFRKSVFEKYGEFRTDFGPCPGSEIRNEDTEFGRRVMAAGERLRYEPSAIVYHLVPETRLKKGYFLAFWFDHGRASVREDVGRKPDIFGIRRCYFSVVRTGLLLATRTLQWTLTWNSQLRFYRKGWVWMTAGEFLEYWRQSVSAK